MPRPPLHKTPCIAPAPAAYAATHTTFTTVTTADAWVMVAVLDTSCTERLQSDHLCRHMERLGGGVHHARAEPVGTPMAPRLVDRAERARRGALRPLDIA